MSTVDHRRGPSQPHGWDEDCLVCNPDPMPNMRTFEDGALARVVALADKWQAEVEDDGGGLTQLEDVLAELLAALTGRGMPDA